ncbi:MAG TPA: DEAD/DEAH box helicase family protein [Kiritimatiellia bacterium]|nr:DEAD/DEAH box helicase family protein [Kiritimatiellia bacterium]
MSRNEAQVRFELIDPALEERGWSRRADIRVEETARTIDIVHGQPRRRSAGRTDYVLRRPLSTGSEPMPLAILEAKHEGKPPEHGLQQGKDYRVGQLHHVPFVFSSNGHLFVEYDEETGATTEPRPLSEFPRPEELIRRYLAIRGLKPEMPEFKLLETPYKQGREHFWYFQDAAIRAAFEKIILDRQNNRPPRVILLIATGGGKTRIAAGMLRRIFDAGFLGKALFVCDRTELRDNGLADFQAAFGNDAAEIDTRHPQKNARVVIATYQTLDHQKRKRGGNPEYDKVGEDAAVDPQSPSIDPSFFLKHYPPGYFDVIVIDECHRSAWGKWFAILKHNAQGIHVGLTATPRTIRLPEAKDAVLAKQIEEDRRLLADNYKYFGEAPYEYTYAQGVADGYLAPCEIEQYDIHHDGELQPERIRGVLRADLADKKLTDLHTGRKLTADAVPEVNEGSALEARLILPDRIKAMCGHLFARLLATGDHTPLQKSIVFCASDHHADLVANEFNALYAAWAKANGQKRIQRYAFKCMSSVNGQALIPDFRGRARSHIVATTKDLLTTGVNVPCVRNIVFFRYVQSPLLFNQMIGRGTRLDEASGKLMFRIFDYTGATALFGADLVTPPPRDPPKPGPEPPQPPKVRAKDIPIEIKDTGRFNLLAKDGRLRRVTPQEYRRELVQQLVAAVPTLRDFRERWLDPVKRAEMMADLRRQNLLPEIVGEGAEMEAYDDFDVLAALAYGIRPLTRAERAAQFGENGPDWLIRLPQPTAKVIRAIVRQFERAGTAALEAKDLWRTPEIRALKGLQALKQGGSPDELVRKTKETIFAA